MAITKSAFNFGFGTILSRISGLGRDMTMAFCFGTNPAIAAFLVAFRFSNLLRRILGEGAFLNSFIPHFESYRSQSPKHAAEFFRDVFFSLAITLISTIFFIEIGLYIYLKCFFVSDENLQIIDLSRLMLPGLLFICLSSLCSGLLHCEKKFFIAELRPLHLI